MAACGFIVAHGALLASVRRRNARLRCTSAEQAELAEAQRLLLSRRRLRDGGLRSDLLMLNRVLLERAHLVQNGQDGLHGAYPLYFVLPRDDFRTQHVHSMLKLKSGDSLKAGCVNGRLFDARVEWTPERELAVYPLIQVASEEDLFRPLLRELPKLRLDVMLAMPRPKVLLRILNHLAAMGVQNIVLNNAYRVEKSYFQSKSVVNSALVYSELLSGVCQGAVDTRIPTVHVARRLKPFLEDELENLVDTKTLCVVAHPDKSASSAEETRSLFHLICAERPHRVLISIGPEGGWTDREIHMLTQQFNFRIISMGELILRTEQAMISLAAIAKEALRSVGPS